MNILYINWKCFGSDDIVAAMQRLGHSVNITSLTDEACTGIDRELIKRICNLISERRIELVVSFNYYPTVSEACMKKGCRYFAWIYDSPYIKLYDKTVVNNVNYVGTFDSSMEQELRGKGVGTVHYVPLAVNSARLRRVIEHGSTRLGKCGDISFIGSLYNDKNNFYERLFEKSRDMELAGYLDAIIESQRKVYGSYFLDECVDENIASKIRRVMPYKVAEGSYTTENRVYADYYLVPRLTFLDRQELISTMARFFEVDYYTHTDYNISGAHNRGTVDYYNEMPVVFNRSKINLNISLRSIRTGIPLRAMDIMGAGGFLLSNYQSDMFRHFEPGVHFDYYTSVEEAVDKADYYLSHDDERSRIAAAAFEEMEKHHTFEIRLAQVISECRHEY